jgi:UDP-N-acetylmuramate dehydrogenase
MELCLHRGGCLKLSDIARQIELIAGPGNLRRNEPMKFHTSLGVGGPADILVNPRGLKALIDILGLCRSENVPFFVMGKGTNLVVRDGGIRGVVIKTCDGVNNFQINQDCTIKAETGARLSEIAAASCENLLAGFEFAAGIPGTLGGAVVMNAGAYDREMKDVIIETTCINDKGELITITGAGHEFGYRSSIMQKKGYIVLKSVIMLERGEKAKIMETMRELAKRRQDKQPLDLPSAGSVFKRPDGYYAGKLIEECGLRGATIGGAKVSEKHCGFIVNNGDATAADVINLIEHIRHDVKRKCGVELQPEVRIIGEDYPGAGGGF